MWLLMDLIPDRFYVIIMEFFVAESQKFLLVKRLYAAARSKEKWLFSQTIQSKTPVKCLGFALGKVGGFGIDWYVNPSLK